MCVFVTYEFYIHVFLHTEEIQGKFKDNRGSEFHKTLGQLRLILKSLVLKRRKRCSRQLQYANEINLSRLFPPQLEVARSDDRGRPEERTDIRFC